MALGLKLLKYIVLGINIALIVLGVIMTSFGTYWFVRALQYTNMEESLVSNGSLNLFAGLVLIIVTAVGSYAMLKKNIVLVGIYGTTLFTTCVIHIIIGSYSIIQINKTDDAYPEHAKLVEGMFHDAYQHNKTNAKETFDSVQENLNCCGAYGFEDYHRLPNGSSFPASCCKNNESPCTDPYKTGCIRAILDDIKKNFRIGAAISFVVAIVSGAGVFFVFKITAIYIQELHLTDLRLEQG